MIEVDERHRTNATFGRVEGYSASSYGDAFADVYDDWYHGVSDVAATVAELLELAGNGPVLELGVGTGRLAMPLAEAGADRGLRVVGVDASTAMLERLAARDPVGRVDAIHGDMIDDLPTGPFSLVFVAYNTLFNLTAPGAHAACFEAVAARLLPGGRFVVEAFVPWDPPRRGDDISVRTLTADRVVLSISVHHPDDRTAEGQFVELSEADGVRLRPWSIRYATPTELDRIAADAGLELEHRWEGFGGMAFTEASERHVSIYRAP